MNSLGKSILREFVDFACERLLLWRLGEGDSRWLQPPHQHPSTSGTGSFARSITDLGKLYEREVYRFLLKNRNTRAQKSSNAASVLAQASLTPAKLGQHFQEMSAPKGAAQLLLLEHEWDTPEDFIRFAFDLPAGSPVPVSAKKARPDLLLLGRESSGAVLEEVLPNGTRRLVPAEELSRRLSLRVVDIKHTNEQSVGKKHFVELIYYTLALSAFLRQHGLESHFFVPIDGHGILPKRDSHELADLLASGPESLIVPLPWRDAYLLVESALQSLRLLWRGAPHAIENTAPNIQPACGRCPFLPDCLETLQGKGQVPPSEWDLRLLPYTSQATAEQLRSHGMRTVRDVATRAGTLPLGTTPEPLHAEIPMLALRAKSLAQGNVLPATPEHTDGQRHLSLAIPRFSDINLFFDAESDPTNDVVFAVGLLLRLSTGRNSAYTPAHDRLWRLMKEGLSTGVSPTEEALEEALDAEYRENSTPQAKSLRKILYPKWFRALQELNQSPGGKLTITLPGEAYPNDNERENQPAPRIAEQTVIRYEYSYVQGGGQDHHQAEQSLAERLVEQLYWILILCHSVEQCARAFLPGKDDKPGKEIGPNFAGFYWSGEQLRHVQNLLERHLPALLQHAILRTQLQHIIHWVAPAESGVQNALQHKKIFDLRVFIETTIGLPHVINYTWHELHAKDQGFDHYSRQYWLPHFNYMDFSAWHQCINERDNNKQRALFEKLQEQLLKKLRALQGIFFKYRSEAGDAISASRQSPVKTEEFFEKTLPGNYHSIARIWELYSRLNATIGELDADWFRTTFPAYSIAKLAAGQATRLQILPNHDPKKLRCSFWLEGLSSNMKIAEGDRALLMPESARDGKQKPSAYEVSLQSMRWDAASQAYEAEAVSVSHFPHPLLTDNPPSLDSDWYLYGTSSDPWTKKLLGLLHRQHIGESWLGARLGLLWQIGTERELAQPQQFEATYPELYLFAPQLLPTKDNDPSAPLRTTSHPTPDASQREAIQIALSSSLSCIQGPPGTGKSQTIAALIDEFLLRRKAAGKGPARVLVTAFSYSAMRVVLDKVRASRDAKNNPTYAASQQLVWMHSVGRPAVPDQEGLPHITDLVIEGKIVHLDGAQCNRRGGKRIEDFLDATKDSIWFANAFSLEKLGVESKSKKKFEFVQDDFGFDLIIIDEGSQVPTPQMLASALLVRPGSVGFRFSGPQPSPNEWPLSDLERIGGIELTRSLPFDEMSRVVIVGDQNQLPPVQPLKPPKKLRIVLDSVFSFYANGHQIPQHQLQTNYRSHPTIVEYTQRLGVYQKTLEAFREAHPYPPLPEPPPAEPWLQQLLHGNRVVGTLLHSREFETAVSPLEAHLVARLVVGFFQQVKPTNAAQEKEFWREQLGVVAPHNAQGRRIIRLITAAIAEGNPRLSFLSPEELARQLTTTVCSVEKFQGADRTFIIGSVGISSREQLSAEEAFIYDLNRFNVLTSRAKQKMLLLCSEKFLEYLPNDRDVMAHAARIRDFAFQFCDQEAPLLVPDEQGKPCTLRWRYRYPL